MFTGVPQPGNKQVDKLLDQLNVLHEAELIPVILEPYARAFQCYTNVSQKVAADGGMIHYGWVIWHLQYMIEAVHHAVWENAHGDLVCITPRSAQVDHILFVSDNSKPYQGENIDSVRLNVSGNPLVDQLIRMYEIRERLVLIGQRIDDNTRMAPVEVKESITEIDTLISNLHLFCMKDGKIGSPCYCGSGKKYSGCHGKEIIPLLDAVQENMINKYG